MTARDPRAFLLADIAIKQTRQNLEDAFDQLPEYARNAILAVEQQLGQARKPRERLKVIDGGVKN